jgi:hypothetical protein
MVREKMRKPELKSLPGGGAAGTPPPAFGHPLAEGDFNGRTSDVNTVSRVPHNIPLHEGVAEGRGRLSGEAPEPFPPHRIVSPIRWAAKIKELQEQIIC